MKIKAVIFDVDGLMFDTESFIGKLISDMAAKRGKIFDDITRAKMMGRARGQAFSIFKESLDLSETLEDIVDEYEQSYLDYVKKNKVNEFKGLFEFMDFLQNEDIKMAIATSSKREIIENILKQHKIETKFDCIFTGEEVKNGKPHPAIYLKTIKHLGLNPGKCLVLEDTQNGVKSGKGAGCLTIAIPNTDTKNHDFSNADKILKNFREVEEYLKSKLSQTAS